MRESDSSSDIWPLLIRLLMVGSMSFGDILEKSYVGPPRVSSRARSRAAFEIVVVSAVVVADAANIAVSAADIFRCCDGLPINDGAV